MTHDVSVIPWAGSAGIRIPVTANEAGAIVPYAIGLRPVERQRVMTAFESGLYDMGAEFVWRRTMTRLRNTIAGLGMNFIGEMLNRADIDDASTVDSILTDYDTIRLTEALGVVNATGALKLRHAFELIAHYAGGGAGEDLPLTDAISVVRSCVQFALGEENISVAVDFSRLRERLIGESLSADDPQIEQLLVQPPFFLSTAFRVLLSAIKTEQGARLQHVLSNLSSILPPTWSRLPETDRWAIGTAYAEASASGNEAIVAELKRALLKVAGFDYVPENLRSAAYRRAAQAVLAAHVSFHNFEAEIAPTRHLASLGSVIPKPAVPECIRALVLVFVGNYYSHSWAAASIARGELMRLASSSWQYYFSDVLPADAQVLEALSQANPAGRFAELVQIINKPEKVTYSTHVERLLAAAEAGDSGKVRSMSDRLLAAYKPTGNPS